MKKIYCMFVLSVVMLFSIIVHAQDAPISNMTPSAGTTTIVREGELFEVTVEFEEDNATCDLWWSGAEGVSTESWAASPMALVGDNLYSITIDTGETGFGRFGFTTRCTLDDEIFWYGDYHDTADGTLLVESQLAPISNILRQRPDAGSVTGYEVGSDEPVTISVDFYLVGVTDSEGQAEGVTCDVWSDIADGIADDNWGAIPMTYSGDAVAGLIDRYTAEVDISELPEGAYGFTTRCDYDGQVYWLNEESLESGGDGILLITAGDVEQAVSQYRRPVDGIDWVGELFPIGGRAHIYDVGEDESLDYFIQVYEAGVTEAEGQGDNIECFLSWGLFNQEPVETPMTYNVDIGNNDEYMATIAIADLSAGNYGVDAYCSFAGDDNRTWREDNLDARPINEGVSIISIVPPSTPTENNVFVHLFEWKWNDIAAECPFLAEVGYSAVQVSPPQEHVMLEAVATDPWWTRYQPVSYQLEGRSGTEAEFVAMVSACDAVGVGIYVDAVINHMSGQSNPPGPGTAGTVYRHKNYPDLYDEDDFNFCPNDISNYQRRYDVQTCELVNLADLATGDPEVQATIRAYLQRLIDMGVAGFRIDAAKHMPAHEITAILDGLEGDYYVFQEVIGAPSEPVLPQEYVINGDVTEFAYSRILGESFNCSRLDAVQRITLNLLRSDDAVVFVDNHDNQRGHGAGGNCVLDHTDGYDKYNLGNIFMLAYPYGYPKVMSSYWWDDGTAGADSNPAPTALVYQDGEPVGCNDTDWVCEHRRPEITAMVDFRRVTDGAEVTDWENITPAQIAFGRGELGFVAINNLEIPLEGHIFQTSMPAGDYCDVLTGGISDDGEGCIGTMIRVNDDGTISGVAVAPMGAFAIHIESRIDDD